MLVIGHRGASADAPENTPEAFDLADEQGADGVELDVRLTSAGELVVRHDPIPPGPVDASPSFARVLDSCGDRMLVNVEIKNLASDGGFDPTMTIARLTIEELHRRGQGGRWLISSFSWSTIAACRAMAPDVMTAFLCTSVDDHTIERVAAAGHTALHPWEHGVDDSLVERCHAAGLLVNTWTCNAPDRLVELDTFGVDGVCTDVPAVALAALGRSPLRLDRAQVGWGRPG